jgi:hypothetical protein
MTLKPFLYSAVAIFSLACVSSCAASSGDAQLSPEEKMIETKGIFPKDNAWNTDISNEAVDPRSDILIGSIGADRPLHPDFGTGHIGIPFQFISKDTPRVDVKLQYADESDPGPYPIPDDVKIEGEPGATEGDRHILLIDPDHWTLYELWACEKTAAGWTAGSGAIFDMTKNPHRPVGWTSADAAGLAIFPGLARYEETHIRKEITHALRFTVAHSLRGYVAPATHYASERTNPALPPMGMRVRLKGDFDITPFPEDVQVILRALKKYGMILADNGSNWFISGAQDDRWDDDALHKLTRVKGSDLEVIKMGVITTSRQ